MMAVNLEIVRKLVETKWSADTCQETRIVRPSELPMDWRIEFEERAAIIEYDGGLDRQVAETRALAEILQRMKTLKALPETNCQEKLQP
jgi:hypothetical protein